MRLVPIPTFDWRANVPELTGLQQLALAVQGKQQTRKQMEASTGRERARWRRLHFAYEKIADDLAAELGVLPCSPGLVGVLS